MIGYEPSQLKCGGAKEAQARRLGGLLTMQEENRDAANWLTDAALSRLLALQKPAASN